MSSLPLREFEKTRPAVATTLQISSEPDHQLTAAGGALGQRDLPFSAYRGRIESSDAAAAVASVRARSSPLWHSTTCPTRSSRRGMVST